MKCKKHNLNLIKCLFSTIKNSWRHCLFFNWVGISMGISLLFYSVYTKIKTQEKLAAIAVSSSPSTESVTDFFKSSIADVFLKHLAIMLCDYNLLGIYRDIRMRELRKMIKATGRKESISQQVKSHTVTTKYQSIVLYNTFILFPRSILMIILTLIKAYMKSEIIFYGILTAIFIFYVSSLLLSVKQSVLKLKMLRSEDKLNCMISGQVSNLPVIKSFMLVATAEEKVKVLLHEHSHKVLSYERMKAINLGLPEIGDFVVMFFVLFLSITTGIRYFSFFEVTLKAATVFKEISILTKEANKMLICLVGISAYQAREENGKLRDLEQNFQHLDFDIFNATVRICRGQKVALYGNCDIGSSVIRAAAGLHQGYEARINTVKTWEINKKFFIENISYIPRDSQVFSGGIMENLLGKNSIDKNTLVRVKELMQNNPDLLSFTKDLPTTLSKGQIGSVNVSRGILKESDLMLIDNSFYCMNQSQKTFFLEKIRKLNRTVLFNANDLEDCKYFDRVICIQENTISEY